MANDVKDDEQNVNLVNESYKEEQERKAREENENRDTVDKVTDFGRDIVDRGFNEVKSRAESEIKDKIFGSGEEAGEAANAAETAGMGTEAGVAEGTAGLGAEEAGLEAGNNVVQGGKLGADAAEKGGEAAVKAGGEAGKTAANVGKTVAEVAPEAGGAGGATAGGATAGATAGGAAVGAGSMATGVGEVIAIIVAIILVIMVFVGIIFYIVTMPGMLKGKISSFVKESTQKVIEAIWEGDSSKINAQSIDIQTRVETLQYLQDMGIDVVGYGFVPGLKFESEQILEEAKDGSTSEEEVKSKYMETMINKGKNNENTGKIVGYYVNLLDNEVNLLDENDESSSDEDKSFMEEYFDNLTSLTGVSGFIARQTKDIIKEKMNPREDLIYYYLMANERAYVKKDSGLFGKIFSSYSPEFTGMLDISDEVDGGTPDGVFNGTTIKVDREKNVLIIDRQVGPTQKDHYEFSLDGWTGRFGMPLEFSLALHLSTMSSGMVEELITNDNLQTTVSIGYGETKCKANLIFNIKDDEGNITSIDLPYNDAEGKPDRLLEKIQRNERVTAEDLSVEGLYRVYQEYGNSSEASNNTDNSDDEDNDDESQTSGVDIHSILASCGKGYDYFTKPRIDYLYEELKNNRVVEDKTVRYVQPYIKRVIRHWYKDLDFEGSYSESSEPISMDYPFDRTIMGDNIDMQTVLTPIQGGVITGNAQQPLVVKGDVVLCDGKKVDSSKLSQLDEPDGYSWGDGYRTTKKIFTQGYYYTFDGTPETARSIFYQEEMEAGKNKLYAFGVYNGRIAVAKEVYGGRSAPVVGVEGGLTAAEIIDGDGNFLDSFKTLESVKNVFSEDGIEVYYIGQNLKKSAGQKLDWYVMYVPDGKLSYISPAQKVGTIVKRYPTQEQVNKRVNTINEVWDKTGVVCKRRHLTFDTVADNESEGNDATEGKIMATTGLAILKNCESQDAEYIYRDLKEMLIELGYYTEAEFEYLDTDVLNWFIPDYMPDTWPQNSAEDFGGFAAVLYPAEASSSEDDADEDSAEEDDEVDFGLTRDKTQGFSPDLEVVAPGDCRIIRNDANGIELEFVSDEEPEIGILDGYTMIINGIKKDEGITIVDEEGESTQISYEDAISRGVIVKAGSIIGKTGTEKISVYMLNDRGEYLSNVEDYMAPEMNSYQNEITSDLAYFYWMPYEGGSFDPGVVSVLSEGKEMAVGIAQWTVLDTGLNNIAPLCQWLYNKNPQLCAELNAFTSWGPRDFLANSEQVKNAFRIVADRNQTALLELEMQYSFEERTRDIEARFPWMLERNPVVVGTCISLINWYPGGDWQGVVNESMTDEQIILALLKKATTYGTQNGFDLTGRWNSQARLAIDILKGRFTDIEGWIQNKGAYPEYGEGNNPGYLK